MSFSLLEGLCTHFNNVIVVQNIFEIAFRIRLRVTEEKWCWSFSPFNFFKLTSDFICLITQEE